MKVKTVFTRGKDPYENIEWETGKAEIVGGDGKSVFLQESVTFPKSWSQRARNIVASKYFYGSGDKRESDLRTLIDRVVVAIANDGMYKGYFIDGEEQSFINELKYILVNQIASFNSPVWFNIGVPGIAQQGSACFINHVEDNIESILELSKAEGNIFKRGSGAGVNISALRGKGEPLSGGGTSSGPLSFMRGLDAQAGVIKSGGVTRRAAKMVLMDVDHPDIMEFIRSKQEEEKKAHALIAAGYDSAIDGEAYLSVFFQNANHSVRLTDDFMNALGSDDDWMVVKRTTGERVPLMKPSAIFKEIADTAHACGDPGVQFTDTINKWHTCKRTGPINASNPCCLIGETMVDTTEGRVSIAELAEMSELPYVFAFDIENNIPTIKKIRRAWKTGEASSLIKLTTEKGIELICTPDHRILLHNGTYKAAGYLEPGDRIRKIARSQNEQRSGRRVLYHRNAGSGEYQSRFVWEQVHGAIPDSYEVHHINEDPTDDRLSNLELVHKTDHRVLHSEGTKNPNSTGINEPALAEAFIELSSQRNQKGGDRFTVQCWNNYINSGRGEGLPKARYQDGTGRVLGMDWFEFKTYAEKTASEYNDKIQSVELLLTVDKPVPVYDIEVEGTHNFAVCQDNHTGLHTIVVHNSEFVFLDNTSCNLASINLLKFWDEENGFDYKKLIHVVRILILAQDILVDLGEYPTEDIDHMTRVTRPLGLGITNLGALLMVMGRPYNSIGGRDMAANIMSCITGTAYEQSAAIAEEQGPFSLFDKNKESMEEVIKMHHRASKLTGELPHHPSQYAWDFVELKRLKPLTYRNAQVTVIAPTGTISFMMDCDTTGMEPLLAPVTYKTLVGGGTIESRPECYKKALEGRTEDDPVLATALGDNALTPEAHLNMLAALQPFVSGAISKTINMPADSTVQDVKDIYINAWKKGVKCVAIYRDGSKGSQPVNTTAQVLKDPAVQKAIKDRIEYKNPFFQLQKTNTDRAQRRKLDKTRDAITHKFDVGGHEGYLTVGFYKDGSVAEIFVNMAKEGSTISGLLGQWALTFSMALQYGVPIDVLIEKHSYVRYEPSGFTGDEKVRNAYSITDYIVRWISSHVVQAAIKDEPVTDTVNNGNTCVRCNGLLVMQGNCHICLTCGDTTGCG